jgi:hypothetical protein
MTMTDESDRALGERMRRLEAAVPVASTVGGAQTVRSRPRVQAGIGGGLFLLVVIGLVIVALAAGLTSGGPPPVATQSATASSPPNGLSPVVGSATDSAFRLIITSSKGTYLPNEAIDVFATLEYLGPEPAIDVGSGLGMPGFGVEQLDGPRRVSPGYRMACKAYPFQAGVPVRFPFTKSGGLDAAGQDPLFLRDYFNVIDNKPDPTLRLPPGIWRIFVEAQYAIGGCSAEPHVLTAALTVTVGASPSPSSTGLVTSPPSGVVSDTAGGWTFDRPASWTSWQPNAFSPHE